MAFWCPARGCLQQNRLSSGPATASKWLRNKRSKLQYMPLARSGFSFQHVVPDTVKILRSVSYDHVHPCLDHRRESPSGFSKFPVNYFAAPLLDSLVHLGRSEKHLGPGVGQVSGRHWLLVGDTNDNLVNQGRPQLGP